MMMLLKCPPLTKDNKTIYFPNHSKLGLKIGLKHLH